MDDYRYEYILPSIIFLVEKFMIGFEIKNTHGNSFHMTQ